jgi:hypothetical protein
VLAPSSFPAPSDHNEGEGAADRREEGANTAEDRGPEPEGEEAVQPRALRIVRFVQDLDSLSDDGVAARRTARGRSCSSRRCPAREGSPSRSCRWAPTSRSATDHARARDGNRAEALHGERRVDGGATRRMGTARLGARDRVRHAARAGRLPRGRGAPMCRRATAPLSADRVRGPRGSAPRWVMVSPGGRQVLAARRAQRHGRSAEVACRSRRVG